MSEIFRELLDVKKLVKQLFEKEAELEEMEAYWISNNKILLKKYLLQEEIKQIKQQLFKLL